MNKRIIEPSSDTLYAVIHNHIQEITEIDPLISFPDIVRERNRISVNHEKWHSAEYRFDLYGKDIPLLQQRQGKRFGVTFRYRPAFTQGETFSDKIKSLHASIDSFVEEIKRLETLSYIPYNIPDLYDHSGQFSAQFAFNTPTTKERKKIITDFLNPSKPELIKSNVFAFEKR